MKNFNSMLKLNLIPGIDDSVMAEMLAIMKPVARVEKRRYRQIEIDNPFVDRRNISYTRSPKLGRPVRIYDGALHSRSILTFHSYGAPAFFKPSLAEVCTSINRFVPDWSKVRWFHLEPVEPMQEKSAGAMLQEGVHVAVCTLFGEESTEVIDSDWDAFAQSCEINASE